MPQKDILRCKMNILITGGAGFIGSNFCHYRYNDSDNFVVLDALTYAGNKDFLENLLDKPNFKFVCGNICDKNLVEKILVEDKIDVVVNFAAESNVDTSVIDPQIFIDTNITGVRVLLDACKKHNTRFHQVSTDEVYGELDDQTSQFHETSPLKPNNPYSVTKAAADMLVLSYHKIFGLHTTISRCANNYGIYQNVEKYIPKCINHVNKGEKIEVHGDGSNIRDWINVLDHCKGISMIIEKGRAGEIYNIGSNNERTNLELAKIILSVMGVKEDKIAFVQDRKSNDKRYSTNYDKISKELGYKPQYTFENSLKNIVEWYTK